MPATFDVARDEILGVFKARWDADTAAIAGYVPEVFFDGVPKGSRPDPEKAWAEVVLRHVQGQQASLSQDTGRRRFERIGIVTVAVFAPLIVAGGLGMGENLAKVAKAAFEGKSTISGVWFRSTRIAEVGASGPWAQWNVISEFRYDEFV